ncbi:hypothetical protein PoB_005701900 [Plakobranchus ocellatus]|uniref:Uncharacterized protein n=1 Tax=Plakobranchus ocellatus TaxID=259542 RepID=A0AAV4CD25_9GAST|nr:hypothetical protein PoB_005701900 [Plakobranchus ocellatus]
MDYAPYSMGFIARSSHIPLIGSAGIVKQHGVTGSVEAILFWQVSGSAEMNRLMHPGQTNENIRADWIKVSPWTACKNAYWELGCTNIGR